MRVMVTGGAGFIGSALCRHLVREAGARVLNLDALTYAANLRSLEPIAADDNYTFLRGNVCDGETLARAFADFRPHAVVHLAAESHVDRSITGSGAFIETNIVGTHRLLEAARAYWEGLSAQSRAGFRLVHVSTDEVYGSLGADGAFAETTPYDPSSPYAASKAASDHLVRAWHTTYGLPVIVTNCSNNFGPYQFPEKLIPLMILNALERKPLPVYGRGENVRDWLFVDDHARALETVLRHGTPGRSYNIGGKAERRNIDVVNAICALLDKARPGAGRHGALVEYVEDRPGHDLRYAIDCSRIERELGWRPRETFESGLEKTVAWYIDSVDWWRPLRRDVYDGRRIGLVGTADAGRARSGT